MKTGSQNKVKLKTPPKKKSLNFVSQPKRKPPNVYTFVILLGKVGSMFSIFAETVGGERGREREDEEEVEERGG